MKLSRLKTAACVMLILFLSFVIVEIFLMGVYQLIDHNFEARQKYFKDRVDRVQGNVASEALANWDWPTESPSPFFGYHITQTEIAKMFDRPAVPHINNYGFLSKDDYPYHKEKNEVVIGIFGGSFAFNWALHEDRVGQLSKKLESSIGVFKGKKVKILNMALGGFKQPQQNFIFTYFYEMFDVVVFLDGLNEIDAFPSPQFPIEYPHYSIKFYLSSGPISKEAEKVKNLRSWLVQLMYLQYRLPWLAYSSLYYTVDKFISVTLNQKIIEKNVELQTKAKEDELFYGRRMPFEEKQELGSKVWSKYTLISHELARRNHVKMFHFIQPNQYLNLKKLTPNELKVAFQDFRAKTMVNGYNLLFREQSLLAKKDVHVSSQLLDIYQNNNEDLYIDSCCHVNARGIDLLTEKMVSILKQNLDSGKSAL